MSLAESTASAAPMQPQEIDVKLKLWRRANLIQPSTRGFCSFVVFLPCLLTIPYNPPVLSVFGDHVELRRKMATSPKAF